MKTDSCNENCTSCVHFGYCIVYWGTNCKRQGGTKIPRMRPTPIEVLEKIGNKSMGQIQVSMSKPEKSPSIAVQKTAREKEVIKKIAKIFDPIRTRVVNWS